MPNAMERAEMLIMAIELGSFSGKRQKNSNKKTFEAFLYSDSGNYFMLEHQKKFLKLYFNEFYNIENNVTQSFILVLASFLIEIQMILSHARL